MSAEIRRILIALDVSPGSLAAAAAAAELAALLRAEITGLFVEDAELLRLSSSPLARELDFLTASARGLETTVLESQMRLHALRARRALERIASSAGVPWTFRVTRGVVAREILAAAQDADLVSLGRSGYSVRRRRLLGRTAQQLLTQRRKVTLLSERPVRLRPPVVVLYDGSEVGREALALAARLAAAIKGPLQVLLLGDRQGELHEEVAKLVDERATDTFIESLGRTRAGGLARAVCHRGGGVVVVPMTGPPLDEELLQALLEEVGCPVLAVS